MKVLEIEGGTGHSVIMIGESFRKVSQYIPCEKVVIITDTNVRNHYLEWFPPHDIIVIDAGEDDVHPRVRGRHLQRPEIVTGHADRADGAGLLEVG